MSLNRNVVLSAVIVTTDLQPSSKTSLRGCVDLQKDELNLHKSVLMCSTPKPRSLGLSYTNNTKNPPTNFNDGHDSLERPREEDLEGPEFSQGSTVNHGSCMQWLAFGDARSGCARWGTPNLDFE